MLLLHIADIHFRAPDCVNPRMDPELPFRTRMVQDVVNRVQDYGGIGALLVGGDIAFQGDPQEYAAANEWLTVFANACGCPMERVFVIPGNHDVDRRVIGQSTAVRNAQAAILRVGSDKREREFRTQFDDRDSGPALVAPLEAYNEFAKVFNCQIYPPEHLFWTQDIPLDGGVRLRIHGLTSTLLSGVDGGDDSRESLYLSPLQTVLDPVEDVINLVLCHHPPDWFVDHEEVNEAICGRAAIHLFGHEHCAKVSCKAGYIRLTVGAVNPDRYKHGWQPSYSLIDVRVLGEGEDRKIEINVHVLQWKSRPERYSPLSTSQGEPVFRHCISIPARIAWVKGTVLAGAPNDTVKADAVEAAMSNEDTRNLVFRFWRLTVSQRREIALHLGLMNDEDLRLPEPERYGRVLLCAAKRGVLDQVAREVAQRETR